MKLEVSIGGKLYEMEFSLGHELVPRSRRRLVQSSIPGHVRAAGADATESNVVRSPVNGIVVCVNVRAGDELKLHDLLLVLEAMKMETKVTAPRPCKVKRVHVAPGQAVKLDQVLAEFEP